MDMDQWNEFLNQVFHGFINEQTRREEIAQSLSKSIMKELAGLKQ